MNPRVISVKPMNNYKLDLIFDNGEERIYDCSSHLDFGVFKELKDKKYFQQVKCKSGTVVWTHNQDICPDTLYLDSITK